MNANNILSIITRTQAVLDHNLIKGRNLGFALSRPFNWAIINTAAVLARQLDKVGGTAADLDRPHMREKHMENPEFNPERADQLVVKLATLRHWTRTLNGYNEIGMGEIVSCLRPNQDEIDAEAIKQRARERVKIERRMGKLKDDRVPARFKEIAHAMYEDELTRKQQLQRLVDDVYFLANSEGAMLFQEDYMLKLEANKVYKDSELADPDEYGHMLEAVLEKCVQPLIRAHDEVQNLMDRSYREQTLRVCDIVLGEIDKLAKEVGISFAKVAKLDASVDKLIDTDEALTIKDEAQIDERDIALSDEALTIKGEAPNVTKLDPKARPSSKARRVKATAQAAAA